MFSHGKLIDRPPDSEDDLLITGVYNSNYRSLRLQRASKLDHQDDAGTTIALKSGHERKRVRELWYESKNTRIIATPLSPLGRAKVDSSALLGESTLITCYSTRPPKRLSTLSLNIING